MKRFKFIYLLAAVVGALSFASCQHPYADWAPGKQDANVGVYFPETQNLVVTAEEIKRAMYDKGEDERRQKSNARVDNKKPDPKAVIEVDLHAHELLDTTAGLTPNEIKDYQLGVFRKTMDEHLKEKGRRIVFIHGKGEGVLRNALITELKHKYKSCTWQDASFQQYGFGATMVIIH